jgi:TonB family protein
MPAPVSVPAPAVSLGKFEAAETAARNPKLPQPDPARAAVFASAGTVSAARLERTVAASGFDDAAAGQPQRAGSGTARIAAAGFDSSAPQSGARRVSASRSVATAGFDALPVSGLKPRAQAEPRAASFHSVEILAKVRPEYTEEARRKRIEGEVWLEILFAADGQARVQRILRPLGYGLDENAVRAAGQIRFRPAREGSVAVDETATVRVQFQLAE